MVGGYRIGSMSGTRLKSRVEPVQQTTASMSSRVLQSVNSMPFGPVKRWMLDMLVISPFVRHSTRLSVTAG